MGISSHWGTGYIAAHAWKEIGAHWGETVNITPKSSKCPAKQKNKGKEKQKKGK